jgi:hypothetical protein
MAALIARTASSETVAVKAAATAAVASAAPALPRPAMSAGQIDDPWLRAVVMTPSVSGELTATVIGPLDMRMLAPLMQRPNDAIAMTFSDDPHHGMRADRFSGSAVVFVSTTTFAGRTASLR